MEERLIPLFGDDRINKLHNSTVAVIGIGGVGGICAITLARCGINNIIIQDFDKVEKSNINRQVVASYKTLGMYKVDVLETMLKEINPNINVIKIKSFFNNENMDVFNFKIDYLIDAIDSFDSKCLLINECLKRKVKFISSMGAAKKLDPSKVVITSIEKTSYDPLAKKIRLNFKNIKFKVASSTECSNCEKLGSYMPVVATFGLKIADYVIKRLTQI